MKWEAPAETRVGIRMSVLLHPQTRHSARGWGKAAAPPLRAVIILQQVGEMSRADARPERGLGPFLCLGRAG